MKNIMTIAVVISLLVGGLGGYAAARSKYRPMLLNKDDQITKQTQDIKTLQDHQTILMQNQKAPDGVMLKDKTMMITKFGQTIPMRDEVVLSDGTRVAPSGRAFFKDGTNITLKEGQGFSFDGKFIDLSK
ncbi:MAG TPA: DUF6799 domain-containing protein [Candidatus Saccharimonadales bacterium]|nr:DUF6799 domain-containing protein [Candidatus Saccharimonadales bacterium]